MKSENSQLLKLIDTIFRHSLKRQSITIAGIEHRIKSLDNPDKRVELLKNYARQHFPKTKYLDYAVENVLTFAEGVIHTADSQSYFEI